MPPFAIGLMVYAHSLPSIFLINQLQHGALSCQNEIRRSVAWEAAELAPNILFEEGHILIFELYRLLGIISQLLDRMLSDPKQVVESYHREVRSCPLYFCRPWLVRHCNKKFGNVRLYW
jgi:hypothetical protein